LGPFEISDEQLLQLLMPPKTIAVVGLSGHPDSPSRTVTLYLLEKGYRIVPINPNHSSIMGMECYPNLESIPGHVDIILVFLPPEKVAEIIGGVTYTGAKLFWMQPGTYSSLAEQRVSEAGLIVLHGRCIASEIRRLTPMMAPAQKPGEERQLVIVGGGPAGLTAGIYAARSRLDVVLYEKAAVGGQAGTTEFIENYPGFAQGINGFELVNSMMEQATRMGMTIENRNVERITTAPDGLLLHTPEGTVLAGAAILATGTSPKRLGVPGESEFAGKGLSWCATCDGPFYKDKEVAVVGGGDSAVKEAVYLTKFAKMVHIIHRRDKFRAAAINAERAKANERITVHWDSVVEEILGEDYIKELKLLNVKTKQPSSLAVEGVFMYVGIKPNSEMVQGAVRTDELGFIITDEEMRTSMPRLFAAGDVRSKTLRQVATAVGDGATAAFAAEEILSLD
jgi:thioredoxin reductase (NADPH)